MGRAGAPRTPAIIHPEDGSVLLAEADTYILNTTIRGGQDSRLLLNGRPIEIGAIEVEMGAHELRVVEPGRPPHTVRFQIGRAQGS